MSSEALGTRPLGRVRSTRQAEVIDAVLREQDGFRTASELFGVMRQRGDKVGLTTVYRHLNLLAELGQADVVHTSDGEAQFRLCGEGPADAEGCFGTTIDLGPVRGRSVEVSAPKVEAWAEQVAAAAGLHRGDAHARGVRAVSRAQQADAPSPRSRPR